MAFLQYLTALRDNPNPVWNSGAGPLPSPASRERAPSTARRVGVRSADCSPSLFLEIRRGPGGEADLEHVERVADRGVIADDRAELDDALLAERRDPFGEARVGQPFRADQLADQLVDQRLVL